MLDPNSFPFCYLPSYFFQNFFASYPYRNSTTPMPQAMTGSSHPRQSSGSSQLESSGSGTSTPRSEIATTSTSTEENKKQDASAMAVDNSQIVRRQTSAIFCGAYQRTFEMSGSSAIRPLAYCTCNYRPDFPSCMFYSCEKSISRKNLILPIEKFPSFVLLRNTIMLQHLIIPFLLC